MKRQMNDKSSEKEWQRVVQWETTSDNEWQRVVTNDNKWQKMIASDEEWQRARTSGHFGWFSLIQIREEPTTMHPKETL